MKLCNIISTTIGLLLLSNHVHAFITSAAVRASDASSLFLSLPGHASNLHLHDRAQRSSQDGMIRMAKPLRRLPTNAPSLKSTLLRCLMQSSIPSIRENIARGGDRGRGGAGLARLAFGAIPGVAFTMAPSIALLLTNRWYVWAVLLASSSLGLWSERTRWGAAVSSPLVTMLLTITLCNVGILPASSPVYSTVFVPLAVPLLLFDADLRKVLRYAGTLLVCFGLGAIGTVLGTLVAALTVPLGLGPNGWKIAAALASRHIGGAVNYVAVCETLGVSADAVVAGLAADNLVVSLYFVFLFWVTKPASSAMPSAPAASTTSNSGDIPSYASPPGEAAEPAEAKLGDPGGVASGGDGNDLVPGVDEPAGALPMNKDTVSYALTAAFALCMSGDFLAKVAFGGRVSAIPLVTLVTVAGATLAPGTVGRLGPVGAQLGVLFMQLFFAVTGAQGSLAVVLGTAPSLLVFSVVQIAAHFGFLVGAGRLLRLPFRELALASNANVGGPTTAAAMAAAKGWKTLVLPALLTGILGYATATFIGIGLGHGMLRSIAGCAA